MRLHPAVRSTFSAALAAALVFLSPGVECHRLAAQVIRGPGAGAGGAPAPVAIGALPLRAGPSGTLSIGANAVSGAPALPAAPWWTPPAAQAGPAAFALELETVSGAAARQSAYVTDVLDVISGGLEIAARPETSGADAFAAGHAIMHSVLGERGHSVQPLETPLMAADADAAGGLRKPAEAGAAETKGDVPAPEPGPAPAAAPTAPRGLAARLYGWKRSFLAGLAAGYGLSFSLPVAGAGLTRTLLAEAAGKRAVFSDFDDTLDKFNAVASPEAVAAIVAVQKSGKQVVVITDRPDAKKEGSKNVTILESLSSVPAADRSGILVASNKGGRILRYDGAGEAKLIYEEPKLTEEQVAQTRSAADAVKARLASLGTEIHDGSKNIPGENVGPYGYALMLKIGTAEATVKEVAAVLQAELDARGMGWEVEPRLAKDPAFPPYVAFSKLDKSLAVRRVAELLKIEARDAFAIGDSMFAPRRKEGGAAPGLKARLLARLARWVSGRPAPLTGNGTDRDMEKGLPGMLTLSVGETADPAMANAFVLPGKGPSVTHRVLHAMAAGKPAERGPGGITGLDLAMGLGIVGFVLAALYVLAQSITGILVAWETILQNLDTPFPGSAYPGFFLGTLGGFGRLLSAAPSGPAAPGDVYGRALEAARKAAREAGLDARGLSFRTASLSLPVGNGRHWTFSFVILSGESSEGNEVSVEFRGAPGAPAAEAEPRARVGRRERLRRATVLGLGEAAFRLGSTLTPEEALAAARKAGLKQAASIELSLREEAESGDKDLWYSVYGTAETAVEVNARTGETREPTPPGGYGMTDDEVRGAAESMARYKGRPYSFTEYNAYVHSMQASLLERGATPAQLELYDRLCAELPIAPGGFNPWSGD